MSDLHSNLQIVLQNSGYRTWLVADDFSPIVGFEDEAAMGFIFVFETVPLLLQHWRLREQSMLRKSVPNLQRAREKAWNMYSVFVCDQPAMDAVTSRQVRQIEEDLERTRKIAACGLASTQDLIQSLLPLLPMQYKPTLEGENIEQRVKKRIAAIAGPEATAAFFEKGVDAVEVARLLGADE